MFYWSILKFTDKTYFKICHAAAIPNIRQKLPEN